MERTCGTIAHYNHGKYGTSVINHGKYGNMVIKQFQVELLVVEIRDYHYFQSTSLIFAV